MVSTEHFFCGFQEQRVRAKMWQHQWRKEHSNLRGSSNHLHLGQPTVVLLDTRWAAFLQKRTSISAHTYKNDPSMDTQTPIPPELAAQRHISLSLMSAICRNLGGRTFYSQCRLQAISTFWAQVPSGCGWKNNVALCLHVSCSESTRENMTVTQI